MKKNTFIALILVCFLLFVTVPLIQVHGDQTDEKKEEVKTEADSDSSKDTKPDESETEPVSDTDTVTDSASETSADTVEPEYQNDPPEPVERVRVSNVPYEDGQSLSVLFYTSEDDWTDLSDPRMGERDIFKYDVVFQRVDNKIFISHIDQMLEVLGPYKGREDIFGEHYESFDKFIKYMPEFKARLTNLGYSRDMITIEELDEINSTIADLKIVLKQNKKDRHFYRESNKMLTKLLIFDADLGSFYIPKTWVQSNWIKNIELGRELLALFETDRAEKVANIINKLSRQIGLDSGNKDLNLDRIIPSLIDIKMTLGSDDIESAIKTLGAMDFKAEKKKVKKQMKASGISEIEKDNLQAEWERLDALQNQRELMYIDFKVNSVDEILEIVAKFKPGISDELYKAMLKEYVVYAFDWVYTGDPRDSDRGSIGGNDVLGTRNFFKGRYIYNKEGIRVFKENIREFQKIKPLLANDKYKDYKTFDEIFLPYETIRADISVLEAFEDHLALASDIYGTDFNQEQDSIIQLSEKFPHDATPFITELEKNNSQHNPFNGDSWKAMTIKKAMDYLDEELKKNEIKEFSSFKKSVEKNMKSYGFIPYDGWKTIPIDDFEKTLIQGLATRQDTLAARKLQVEVLDDTFKIIKSHRRQATRMDVETLDVEGAKKPIEDCMDSLDKYVIDRFGLAEGTSPDSVAREIAMAARALDDPDLDYKEALEILENGTYTEVKIRLKKEISAEDLTEEQKQILEQKLQAAEKLPEHIRKLKEYTKGESLTRLETYMDVYSMANIYKPGFEADLHCLENMKDKFTYDKLEQMVMLNHKLNLDYYAGAEILLGGHFVSFRQKGLNYLPVTILKSKRDNRFLLTVRATDTDRQISYSVPFGPYAGTPEWTKPKIYRVMLGVLIYLIIFLFFFNMARSGKDIYVRPIAGLSAVDEAVGRATEMGRPVLYISGLSSISDIATLASINILGQVAKKIALYETPLIVPSYDPIVYTVQKEVVREAYLDVGKPDAFNEDSVFFLTQAQFAYAAGVNGIMVREKPATVFFMGMFFAESLIMAETGNMIGAIQIAGTDAVTQLPFFIVACDYTLIGEELYAASAYLSNDPLLLGTLKTQDTGKMIIMILLLIGIILHTFGFWQTAFINFFENVPK